MGLGYQKLNKIYDLETHLHSTRINNRKKYIFVPVMRKFTLLVAFTIGALYCEAQLDVGLFVGGSYYIGDLNPAYPFLQTNLAYGVLARYNLNARWAVRVNAYKGLLAGDDKKSHFLEDRSLKFSTSIWELANVYEFNFFPYVTGSQKNYFTPYLFGGVGLLYFKPKLGNLELRDKGTEGQNNGSYLDPNNSDARKYSYFTFSIPFGMGVKYSFSRRISATLEWGMRKTFTDYIDDVSQTYYTSVQLTQNDTQAYQDLTFSDPNLDHQPNMQRGNSKTNDWYSFAGLTLTYHISLLNRNKCSEFQEKN